MATLSRNLWPAMIRMYITFLCLSDKRIILTLPLIFVLALSPLILTKQVKERMVKTVKEDEHIPGTRKENYRNTKAPFGRGVTLGVLAGLFAIIRHCLGASSFIIV